jgi:hypothetical protein
MIEPIDVKLSRYRNASDKGERKYSSDSVLISALDVGEWLDSRPDRALPPRKYPSAHWIGGCVGLRAGLDTEARGKILCLFRGSILGRPVCSQTVY